MQMQINAQLIKQLREQKCWSQIQLAEMAGVSLRTLQRVEAKGVASQETTKSLAAVLELNCEQLVEGISRDAEQRVDDKSCDQTGLQTSSATSKKVKIKLAASALVVALVYAFALESIFTAFEQQRLDEAGFQFYKNLASGAFLLGLTGVFVSAWRKGLVIKTDLF